MRIADRVLLILLSLALVVVAGMLFAATAGWDPVSLLRDFGAALVAGRDFETPLAGLVLFALGVYVFVSGARSGREGFSLVQETSLGSVRISSRTIETLVRRAARDVHGIRDVEPVITVGRDQSLLVRLGVSIAPDLSIPEISEQVQRQVEGYLARTVGVTPAQVQVAVRSVTSEVKPRVE